MGEQEQKISGHVVKGAERASYFTNLPWVQAQCLKKLGFKPWPGTLNISVDSHAADFIVSMNKSGSTLLEPPDSSFCTAEIRAVSINDAPAALIVPEKKVNIHGDQIIEILAPVHLRTSLNLQDGDLVNVYFEKPEADAGLDLNALLFDLDGTLIDSVDSYYRIVEIALEQMNFPPVRRELIFRAAQHSRFNWKMVLPEGSDQFYEKTVKKASKLIDKIYEKEFLKNVKPFDSARQVLKILIRAGKRIGIVTSTPEKSIQHKMKILDQAGLLDLVEEVIYDRDVTRKKPYPDPLLLCRDRMGLESERCAYVGDMKIDIQAGKAAGMKTIGVLSGFETREGLEAEQPDVIVDSIDDLLSVLRL